MKSGGSLAPFFKETLVDYKNGSTLGVHDPPLFYTTLSPSSASGRFATK